MITKPFDEILKRAVKIEFHEEFDLVVAVARGGVIPGAIMQLRLDLPLEIIYLRFRDDSQNPLYDVPRLERPLSFNPLGKKILLVDDRSRTGATLDRAKALLSTAEYVKTLAVNGKSDYSLFDEECFYFPWRPDREDLRD